MNILKSPSFSQTLLFFLVWVCMLGFFACQPSFEKFTDDPNAKLAFSDEAVVFDTIFTDIKSITKRFRVYNPNKNALNISQIQIGEGANSPYSLIINGKQGHEFQDIDLLGGDSLLILFVENSILSEGKTLSLMIVLSLS